jgi:hypothetical protein
MRLVYETLNHDKSIMTSVFLHNFCILHEFNVKLLTLHISTSFSYSTSITNQLINYAICQQ